MQGAGIVAGAVVSRIGGSGTESPSARGTGSPSAAGRTGPLWGGVASSRSTGREGRAASVAAPTLEQLLSRVPGDDRPKVRAFVEDLTRHGAPEDLIRWHVTQAIPSEKLPPLPVRSAGRSATSAPRTPLLRVLDPGLPPRIRRAILALSPEARGRVEVFAKDLAIAGLSEETIAWNIARHLHLAPGVDPRAGARKGWQRRSARDPYMTVQRQVLLARAGIEPGRTCDLARAAGYSWRTARRGLAALLARGYVSRHEDADGNQVWTPTKKGTAWLARIPEIEQKMAEGPVHALLLILERADLCKRYRALGWSYDQCRDVVPHMTVDHLTRQITEVVHLHHEGTVENPGGLLWWRLGIVSRGRKNGRMLARMVAKGIRWRFVDAAIDLGRKEATALRLQGLATKVVPDGLGGVFLELVASEPFYVARRLAFTLAKQARSGRAVTVSSVHATLHWIRKELAKRQRPSPEETGEARK